MAIIIAAIIGGLLWMMPVYPKQHQLKFTALAFLLFPVALVLTFQTKWLLMLAALLPGILGIIADIINGRFR